MPAGTRAVNQPCAPAHFIQTVSLTQLLAEMMQSHMVKDICLIGGKVRMAASLLAFTLGFEWTHPSPDGVSICRAAGKRSSLRTLPLS